MSSPVSSNDKNLLCTPELDGTRYYKKLFFQNAL